jgi:signal peptidase
MENSERISIKDGDLIRKEDIMRFNDITTYVEGVKKDHRMAGSYGDVLIFQPNGDATKTLIVHRAVVCIYFNSSTYDDLYGSGGGYDIPSMGLFNVDGVILIEDYEWPQDPDRSDLRIDLGMILGSFQKKGMKPHSGFLTKGDNNNVLDQMGVYHRDGDLMEPVTVNWIVGKMKDKITMNPLLVSTCFSIILLISSWIITIILNVRERRPKSL